jgi:hypothetical protein
MNAAGWRRFHGALVPTLAVGAILLVLLFLGTVVDLDRAIVPKPSLKALALEDYPAATSLKDAGLIVETTLWWLCLSVVLWVLGLAALALCWWLLHRAAGHDAAIDRVARRLLLLAIVLAVATLFYLAKISNTPLMSFGHLVGNLGMVSAGFNRLATLNTALVFVVGTVLLLCASLLLLPGSHADQPMRQMHAITQVMYIGAAFLLVWISAATAMYRLSALLLVPEAREPMLKLAPTISLMTGLFLSLLLAAAYLAACAWLQCRHEKMPRDAASAAADGTSPKAFLAAHWPKVIAIVMPLLPGAAASVLQAVAHAP